MQPNVPAALEFMQREVRLVFVEILQVCDRKEFGGMLCEARGVRGGARLCAGLCAVDE